MGACLSSSRPAGGAAGDGAAHVPHTNNVVNELDIKQLARETHCA